ncbi:MAG: tetratricopeptide repeat protein [Proteobacteria bacterium]|nr:tetratricopeptide repeat protein [Pseudomonadota bacterium]MBU1451595.1 tetratricopeptide repeat protein [Pseudomonadota bacterium]MBU2469309.1 tetratricopeptide repeat protein [Pseudomonadota bacterium]MBU2519110.1 tetratricopeptide repeat protein [Pseudomonadota bacterium]
MHRIIALLVCLIVLLAMGLTLGGCGNSSLEQGLRAERAGNEHDAFAAYSAAIASTFMVSNKRSQAYAGRAGIYVERGKLELALKDLDKALQQDAQCEAAYYNRAVLYLLQGKPELAQGDAKRLIELDPQVPAARRLYDLVQKPPAKFTLPLTWMKATKK